VTYTFALDTTSKESSISILRNNCTLAEYNFKPTDSLSSSLFPAIDFVFKHTGLNPNEIDLFGIAIGPGLFTGIRVGMSALKGLLLHKKKPLIPVTTLKALANKCTGCEGNIIPIIDARKDEVYLSGYHFKNGVIQEIIPSQLLHIAEIKEKLKGLKNLCFIGSGVEVYGEKLKRISTTINLSFRSNFLANEIGKIAQEEYLRGNYIKDLQKLKPVYIRKPDVNPNYTNKGVNKNT
jgi:tRNA threonylcarbamoyladenosine biosynthesis protein TsaB